jgi:hypothetical protein
MRHAAAILASIALTSGCASPAERDLEAVKSARSVLAEWALVESQAARGDTPTTYAEEMRKAAADQLRTAGKTLSERQPEAASRLALPEGQPADAARLQQLRDSLGPLETALADS